VSDETPIFLVAWYADKYILKKGVVRDGGDMIEQLHTIVIYTFAQDSNASWDSSESRRSWERMSRAKVNSGC
jgi:hypothetical protein